MKNAIPALLFASTAVFAFAAIVPAQTSPQAAPTPSFSKADTGQHRETVTGRVIKLDINAGTFSVRIGATGQVVDLVAGEQVQLTRVRRGERVIVTYSGNVATKLEATRSEK
ncbi:MAG TPA: hypothetical protein VEC38_07940 [Candidatus Binataceae bacterium]|nr:hypothetical protein [Candidatus Binataceae bacterium]